MDTKIQAYDYSVAVTTHIYVQAHPAYPTRRDCICTILMLQYPATQAQETTVDRLCLPTSNDTQLKARVRNVQSPPS